MQGTKVLAGFTDLNEARKLSGLNKSVWSVMSVTVYGSAQEFLEEIASQTVITHPGK